MSDIYDALKWAKAYSDLKWAKGPVEAKCRECGAEGFDNVSIKVPTKGGEYNMWVCQKCGYKFVFSESGSIGCVRIINGEPPECSVKPRQLLSGDET